MVVTSRQHAIQDATLEWLDTNFPGTFQEVYFGNHFVSQPGGWRAVRHPGGRGAVRGARIAPWPLRESSSVSARRSCGDATTHTPHPRQAMEGTSRKKSDICASIGADVLIDDNVGYALDCAHNGIRVLLYDWEGGYPWSKLPKG
jgi:hypothetical protein